MATCPKCGNKINETDFFCMKCGEKQLLQDNANNDVRTISKKSISKRVIICIVAAAILIIIMAFILLHQKPSNFLDIEWKSTPDEATAIIVSELEEKGISYHVNHFADHLDISVNLFDDAYDPFFNIYSNASYGFGRVSVNIYFEGDRINRIDYDFLGDYSRTVQGVTEKYGEPIESGAISSWFNKAYSRWRLTQTEVEVSTFVPGHTPTGISITFRPLEAKS